MMRQNVMFGFFLFSFSFLIGCHDQKNASLYQFQGEPDVRVTGERIPPAVPPAGSTTTTTSSTAPTVVAPVNTVPLPTRQVYTPGDINGDGNRDFLIGAPFAKRNGNTVGAVDIYSTTNLTAPLTRIEGLRQPGYFSFSVTMLGDLNRDGFEDFAVGDDGESVLPGFSPGTLGQVTIFAGGSDMANLQRLQTLTGESLGDHFGVSLALLGDVTNDGISDFAIGAPYFDGLNNGVPTPDSGKVYIYNGSDFTPLATIETGNADDHFGQALALAGDTNGDGSRELMVAATGNSASPGTVFLFSLRNLRGQVANTAAQSVVSGEANGDEFGSALVSLGDLDRDGMNDIAVSAVTANRKSGKVYAFSGKDLNTIANPSAGTEGFPVLFCSPPPPGQTPGQCGLSLARAGDLNADGMGDLLVGAPSINQQRGNLFVIDAASLFQYVPGTFPRVPQASRTIMTVEGTNSRDNLGRTVSGLEDVVGADGIADILIGAPTAGGANGHVYVFSGALSGSANILNISQASALFQGQNQENLGTSLFAL